MAIKYDLIVIGAGPGGYTAACKAAEFGLRTLVVEGKRVGGTCVNRGCIPTKALLYASNVFRTMQNCDRFGVYTDEISFDFRKMHKYKKHAVVTYRQEIEDKFRKLGVDVEFGAARLRRGRTVEVELNDGGREFYQGENIIIATGTEPMKASIPGADLPGVLDSDHMLAADKWNFDRVTIMGGGVIAVEFATILNNLCSQVTIVEREQHLMSQMDEETSIALENSLRRKGIYVYCGATVSKISEASAGLLCTVTPNEGNGDPFTIRAGQVLMAIGRRPFTQGLFGPDISLQMSGGKIAVNDDFETSEPGVYAVGDVSAKVRLAHVAAAQGTYVVEKIAGRKHSVRLEVVPGGMFVKLPVVPSCIYTNPEIATVGLTEEAAKAAGLKVRCGRFSMSENVKSIITGQEYGFIRLVFEAYSNALVGAQMMCPRATDMIGELATAVANGLTAEQMSYAMRTQPTYNEAIGAAIENALKNM